MKKAFQSFSNRLTRRILLGVMAMMMIVCGLLFVASILSMTEETKGRYVGILHVANEKLEKILQENEDVVINVANTVEQNLETPEIVMKVLASELQLNPNTQGYFAAFEPNFFPSKGEFFEPYAFWNGKHQIDTLNAGKNTHNYFRRPWYKEALQSKDGIWSDPYFDQINDGQVLCSYVRPIHNNGKKIGVVGSDVSLDWLMTQLESIEIHSYKRGLLNINNRDGIFSYHIFIISKNGTFIAHHNRQRILKENIIDYAKSTPDTLDDHLVREMLNLKEGVIAMNLDGKRSHVIYKPIENSQWSMGIVIPEIAIYGPGLLLGFITLILFLIGMQATYYFCRKTIHHNTLPLKALADSANEVAKGNFINALPKIKYNDEIRELRDSFATMQQSLVKYMNELETTTAKKAAIDRELNIAHNIQMAMIPKKIPPFPERNDIDIYGSLKSAKSIGGDLFDYFIRDEKLFFCIGDVSGKSVPAALVMTVVHALFRTVATHETEPNKMVNIMNQPFAEENEEMMFCTFFLGVLDLKTGNLKYTNAGHEPTMLVSDKVEFLEITRNLPLGIDKEHIYDTQQIEIGKDTIIFLYTDGLTDATNIDNQRFGKERMIKVLDQLKESDTETLVKGMMRSIDEFVGEADQADDLTMLAIRIK